MTKKRSDLQARQRETLHIPPEMMAKLQRALEKHLQWAKGKLETDRGAVAPGEQQETSSK